jgi:hypothetical protein
VPDGQLVSLPAPLGPAVRENVCVIKSLGS